MPVKKTLPKTDLAWKEVIDAFGLQSLSIHTCKAKSGSKIEFEQFLLLRSLWLDTKKPWALNECFGEDRRSTFHSQRVKANTFLDNFTSWDTYLEMIQHNLKLEKYSSQGTFALSLQYQRLCHHTTQTPPEDAEDIFKVIVSPRGSSGKERQQASTPPTPTPIDMNAAQDDFPDISTLDLSPNTLYLAAESSQPPQPIPRGNASSSEQASDPIEDEQIVNTALLLFLQSLTVHYAELDFTWSLKRYAFVLQDNNDQKVYEAQVDGLLRDNRTNEPKIIVEVKPFIRKAIPAVYAKIRMQETAQMAAWIAMHPPPPSNTMHRSMAPSLSTTTI
ncbi:unnamed protein product [Clonostachys rosea f. rosea IK726]|uniref:Uncharacterized protein n=2 Tax=Bionectria ochroleuca TaxID=29856 RepID=A0A0B7JXB0_BIOOC|nr:unnamed protein product [Clonostachys rosea f. rosea IK726]